MSGAYQAIIALMPPHDTYIELFAGSGVVLLRKSPAACSYAVDRASDALAWIGARLGPGGGVQLVQADAFDFLASFPWSSSGRVLIYADPPYLHSLRTSRHMYQFELTDADHVRLLDVLQRVPAAVILSGYPSALYDDSLAGWRSLEYQAMTRGGARTEKLWFNFLPASAHWATFAGRNFTDRQRIKRKVARWARNFRRLPAGERVAVLAGLLCSQVAGHPIDAGGCVRSRGSVQLESSDSSMVDVARARAWSDSSMRDPCP